MRVRINPRRTAHARYGPQGYESITRGLPLVACGVHGLATLVDSIWESTHALRCASLCLQGTQTERIYQFQWIGFFARHISRTLSFQENHCFFSGSHSSEPNDIAYNPLRGLYKRRQTHVQPSLRMRAEGNDSCHYVYLLTNFQFLPFTIV